MTDASVLPTHSTHTPVRDDWAYEAAAEIYALALASPHPAACVDLIALRLRSAHLRGAGEAIRETIADMERRAS